MDSHTANMMTNDPFTESARVIEATGTECRDAIERAATLCIDAIRRGGKLMICGNGGSMAEACHAAAENVVRLRSDNDRPAIPMTALGTNPAVVTACANDYSFERIFAREIEADGKPDDVLICLTTSNKSANIHAAIAQHLWGHRSKQAGHSIVICGQQDDWPGDGAGYVSHIEIPSRDTARIQEATLVVIHELCRLIEEGVCDG